MNFKLASLLLIAVAFTSAADLTAADVNRSQVIVRSMNQLIVALNNFRSNLNSLEVFNQLFFANSTVLVNSLSSFNASQSNVEFVASVSDAINQLQALALDTNTTADDVAFSSLSNVRVAVLNFANAVDGASDNLVALAQSSFGNLRNPAMVSIMNLTDMVRMVMDMNADELASSLLAAVRQDTFSLQFAVQNATVNFRNAVAVEQARLRALNHSGSN